MFCGQAVHVGDMIKCVVTFAFTCVYVFFLYLYVCFGVSLAHYLFVYGAESDVVYHMFCNV